MKDDIIRNKKDLEKATGLKVLGEIAPLPKLEDLKVPDTTLIEKLRARLEALRRWKR